MNQFKRGTPAFGIVLGIVFTAAGALVMTIGFWKTLVLVLLFAAGYFLGAVGNKQEFARNLANRVIPEKNDKPIDLRETLTREQKAAVEMLKKEEEDSSDGE